jgi:DNA-binding NarL/FixJ family response regulator
MTIRVLIADDHPLIRDALKAALGACGIRIDKMLSMLRRCW